MADLRGVLGFTEGVNIETEFHFVPQRLFELNSPLHVLKESISSLSVPSVGTKLRVSAKKHLY